MCLQVLRYSRFNNSGIGYKILLRNSSGKLASFYQNTVWKHNEITAENMNDETITKKHRQPYLGRQYYGIHVFPNKKDALVAYQEAVDEPSNESVVLVKVYVRGFIVAGKHVFSSAAADGKRGECWTHAKVVEVIKEKNNPQ